MLKFIDRWFPNGVVFICCIIVTAVILFSYAVVGDAVLAAEEEVQQEVAEQKDKETEAKNKAFAEAFPEKVKEIRTKDINSAIAKLQLELKNMEGNQ